MSRIEELIKQKCPDGVEYFPLLTVANVLYGYPCDASLFNTKSDGKPLARIRDVLSGVSDTYTTENVPGRYELTKGDLLVGMDGNFHVANWKTDGGILCQRVCKVYSVDVENTITNGYLSHILGPIIKKIEEGKPSGTVKHLLDKDIKAIEIPVPPIEVQLEIVRILDKFTELEAELQAELDARKKQYQYYLDDYFDSQTKNLQSLSEIGTLQRGKRFVHADAVENDGVACIHYGELYTYYGIYTNYARSRIREELRPKMRYAHKGDVIIVGAGENNIDIGVGVVWDGEEDVAVHDACYTLKHQQNPKYISYYLRSSFYHNQIKRFVSEGKICSISAEGIGRAIIPIPSMEEQNRVVKIFDNFDAISNDKILGLQAEIILRHKQYEYYRDLLLTFERTE